MKNQHKQTKQGDPKNTTLKEGGYSGLEINFFVREPAGD